jgi:hypothetical protein
MQVVIIPAEAYKLVRGHLDADKKIAAIKALRLAAPLDVNGKTLGLREAKDAVERLAHELLPDRRRSGWSPAHDAMQILAGPIVKEILCDFGTGLVTVDVEGMQLKALSQLESIGLDACGRMLELCTVIKAFSEGKKIGIIEGEEE